VTIRDLPVHTIFYTAFDYPAESFLLDFALADDPSGRLTSQWVATNRRGVRQWFPVEDGRDAFFEGDPSLVFTLPMSLASAPQRFTDTVAWLWHSPTARYSRRTLRGAGERTGRHPLHGDAQTPPRGRHARILTDTVYHLAMDWAFPFCLRGEGEEGRGTRLTPLGVGGRGSTICNTPVRPYREVRRVKFVERDGRIVTLDLDSGRELVAPPSRHADVKHVKLPHQGGFIYLHKVWRSVMAARSELDKRREAREWIERDVSYLANLTHLYSMTYGSCIPGGPAGQDETRGLISQVHAKVTRLSRHAAEQLAAIDAAASEAPSLRWLAQTLWSSSHFHRAWRQDWQQFPHFCGPLSFLLAATWTIRTSPLSESTLERWSPFLLGRNGRGAPDVTRDESADPMLIDRAYRPRTEPLSDEDQVEWMNRSVTVWAEVHKLFAHRLAAGLVRFVDARADVSRERLERFLELVTGMSNNAARRHINQVLSGTGPYQPRSRVYRERLDAVQFLSRESCPRLGEVTDGLLRAVQVAAFAKSIQEFGDAWTPNDFMDFGKLVLDVTDTGATILGTTGARNLSRALGPVLAGADLLCDVRDLPQMYAEGRASDVSLRLVQSAGSALVVLSYPLSFVPGLGPGLLAAGTAIQVGCAIYGEVREVFRERYQKQGMGVYSLLVFADEARELGLRSSAGFGQEWLEQAAADQLRSRFGRYLHPLQRHVVAKYAFHRERYRLEGAIDLLDRTPTLETMLGEDYFWRFFPEGRWRYLDMGENTFQARNAYVSHCSRLSNSWTTHRRPSEPGPLPAPPPLLYGSP
jgi:hypothetical protein